MSETQDIVKGLRKLILSDVRLHVHLPVVADAADEITSLRTLLNDAVAALEEAKDVLDNYADVEDGDEGRPRANKAMQAQLEIESALWKLKHALPPPAQEGE